jgi:hypothetical protein
MFFALAVVNIGRKILQLTMIIVVDTARYSSFPTRVSCVSSEETQREGCFAMAYFGLYTRIPQRLHLDST